MSLQRGLRSFAADTRGNVAAITVFLLVPLLVMAGGATDIARQESYRAKLQDSVDRAVLAAASLDQKDTVAKTVSEYLKSLSFAGDVTVTPTYVTKTNSKTVTVTASYVMPTYFLHFIGKENLTITASATAEEKRTNIEISLMLDVSGSMKDKLSGTNTRRIDEMKTAAKAFLDIVLTDTAKEYTSVNIVPYAGDVNVGASIFNGLGGARTHNNSSCFEYYNSNYTGGMPNLAGRAQVPHFSQSNWNQTTADQDKGWCPSESSAISIFSDSASALKTRITNYRMADGTGTAIAMDWGILLLNPALRPYVQQAAQIGMVPNKFKDRPADWNDLNTKKFVVLMTDGGVSDQYRPKDPNKDINTQPSNNTVQNRASAVALLQTFCTFAKGKQVTVFTVGFEVPSTYESEMRSCATNASHYYPVKGLNLTKAFESIATAIQKIKLTN
jgi:Flp pilus assembly protein TadG